MSFGNMGSLGYGGAAWEGEAIKRQAAERAAAEQQAAAQQAATSYDQGRQFFQEGIIDRQQGNRDNESRENLAMQKWELEQKYKKDPHEFWKKSVMADKANEVGLATVGAMSGMFGGQGNQSQNVDLLDNDGQRIGGSWMSSRMNGTKGGPSPLYQSLMGS